MMLVRRCEMLPIECIVRGHLAGSAWKEYRERGTIHGTRCAAGPAGGRRAAGARVHALDQGGERRRTTRTSRFDDAVALVGGDAGRGGAGAVAGGVRAGRAPTPPSAASSSPTRSSSSALLDGRLVLADEVLTPDSSRFWPAGGVRAGHARRRATTSSPCGTGWRRPAGTSGRRRRRCPPRWSRRPAARYVEIYERLVRADPSPTGPVGRPEGCRRACHDGGVKFSVLVEVRLRPGIADPQGATIERSLPALGFDEVAGVTVGKAIRFTIEAPRRRRPPGPGSPSCASGS